MDKFSENIMKINQEIYREIDRIQSLKDEETMLDNLISHIQNFVNAIALKIYSVEHFDVGFNEEDIKQAFQYIKTIEGGSFLNRLHRRLQTSITYLTPISQAYIRLMWSFYDNLNDCKEYLKTNMCYCAAVGRM